MTISISARFAESNPGWTDATATQTTSSALDGVQIAKADGLRGALGLYQVTVDGRTQFMTQDEVESLPHAMSMAQQAAAETKPTSSVVKQANDTIKSTIAKGFG